MSLASNVAGVRYFQQPLTQKSLQTRRAWLIGTLAVYAGCAAPAMRSQSPEPGEAAEAESNVRLVGDITRVVGMSYQKIESVALVTGLADTGSDASPSPQRAVLLSEMQTRDVRNPQAILASPKTSLVLVQAYLAPGVQKGDRFDLEVRIASRSETKSLVGGWLMQTRLKELAVLGNQIHSGHIRALGQGPVLVDALIEGEDDQIHQTRGRVLGGGVATKSRSLGLTLRGDHQSVQASSLIGAAINKRFHIFQHGLKKAVAKPMRDNFIELAVHPRYKDNLPRYIRVINNIPIHESPVEQSKRLEQLEQQLMQPSTSALAAVKLEALGRDGVDLLKKGLKANNDEVRFYAAEALAYLNEPAAADQLAKNAKADLALRQRALTALGKIDDMAAYERLSDLLHVSSAETRYGAFSALLARTPHDPQLRGEDLGGQFRYHLVQTSGQPMVHIARRRHPKIVVFGHQLRLETPMFLSVGKAIIVKSIEADRLKVSRFDPGKPDRHLECSASLNELIRTIVKLDGTYPDVVEALQEMKAREYLAVRVVVDSIPRSGRTYHRRAGEHDPREDSQQPAQEASTAADSSTPLADRGEGAHKSPPGAVENHPHRKPGLQPWRDYFATMFRWRNR